MSKVNFVIFNYYFKLLFIIVIGIFVLNYIFRYSVDFREDTTFSFLVPELKDDEVLADSIFFIDTSHVFELRKNFISIGSRQGCCIEAAANIHRNKTIYVLFAYPVGMITKHDRVKTYLKLLNYDNIIFRTVDFKKFCSGTPLEEWCNSDKLKKSIYLHEHSSDVLRYIALWKYGGTYLDTDVLLIKHLDSLSPNYACFEEDNLLNGAVLNIDTSIHGRRLTESCMKDLSESFDGNAWGHNGPKLVTRVFQKICNTKNLGKEDSHLICEGAHILPNYYFYPILYTSWLKFFDPIQFSETMQRVNQSYGLHLWNKLSKAHKVMKHEESVYSYYAKQYCPIVYQASDYL